MAHTTYLWWFGGWFVIVLPTLWNYAVLGFTMLPLSQPLSAASLVQPFFIQLRCRPFAAAPTPNPAVLANELRWCAISREKRHQLPLKVCCETSFKEILFLINPVQKKKGKVWESPPAHCNFRGCFPPPVERFDSLVVTESLFGKRCPRHASWNAIRSKLRAFKPGMSYHKITKISRTTSNFRRTVIFQVLPQWRCTSQKPRCLTKCCRCDIHALHAWWPPTPGRFLWRKDGCRRIGTPQITGSNTKLRFLTG